MDTRKIKANLIRKCDVQELRLDDRFISGSPKKLSATAASKGGAPISSRTELSVSEVGKRKEPFCLFRR